MKDNPNVKQGKIGFVFDPQAKHNRYDDLKYTVWEQADIHTGWRVIEKASK